MKKLVILIVLFMMSGSFDSCPACANNFWFSRENQKQTTIVIEAFEVEPLGIAGGEISADTATSDAESTDETADPPDQIVSSWNYWYEVSGEAMFVKKSVLLSNGDVMLFGANTKGDAFSIDRLTPSGARVCSRINYGNEPSFSVKTASALFGKVFVAGEYSFQLADGTIQSDIMLFSISENCDVMGVSGFDYHGLEHPVVILQRGTQLLIVGLSRQNGHYTPFYLETDNTGSNPVMRETGLADTIVHDVIIHDGNTLYSVGSRLLGTDVHHAWIAGLTLEGDLVWEKVLPVTGFNSYAYRIILRDSGLIIAGGQTEYLTDGTTVGSIFLERTSLTGELFVMSPSMVSANVSEIISDMVGGDQGPVYIISRLSQPGQYSQARVMSFDPTTLIPMDEVVVKSNGVHTSLGDAIIMDDAGVLMSGSQYDGGGRSRGQVIKTDSDLLFPENPTSM
ncbi:MAG TPA: hypothetical protein VJA22_00050 [Patescibacteria group bacterium]|nr:hypothetical protein [Patescibacteria group bacterium]